MRKFFSSISPTAWLLSATILAATALVCHSFKDYDRYYYCRRGSDNSYYSILDTKTGIMYHTGEKLSNFYDFPNGALTRREKKELAQ